MHVFVNGHIKKIGWATNRAGAADKLKCFVVVFSSMNNMRAQFYGILTYDVTGWLRLIFLKC